MVNTVLFLVLIRLAATFVNTLLRHSLCCIAFQRASEAGYLCGVCLRLSLGPQLRIFWKSRAVRQSASAGRTRSLPRAVYSHGFLCGLLKSCNHPAPCLLCLFKQLIIKLPLQQCSVQHLDFSIAASPSSLEARVGCATPQRPWSATWR
jgi:hypothetical protein